MKRMIGYQAALLLAAACIARGQSVQTDTAPADPLRPWRQNLTIRPMLPDLSAHSLHSYFGISPESPDEKWVLAFTSEKADAQFGTLIQIERQTGRVVTLDPLIEVEDAHRQANQQWVCGGRYIVYMALTDGQWQTIRVDPVNQQKTILATGRQLGWGQPNLDVVPLYGLHWNPGEHRDLELLNVNTGEIRTVLRASQVVKDHRDYVTQKFGQDDKIMSIFFPMLSPDGRRVIFKLSSPRNGDFRSGKASTREGLFVYDVATGQSRGPSAKWDHPAWHADSRHIQNSKQVIDTDTMAMREIAGLPRFNVGVHASTSMDGSLIAADVLKESYLPDPQRWSVLILEAARGQYQIIDTAPAAGHGTQSWRPAHPHPSFNARGNRLYYNVPGKAWTTLYVAEIH